MAEASIRAPTRLSHPPPNAIRGAVEPAAGKEEGGRGAQRGLQEGSRRVLFMGLGCRGPARGQIARHRPNRASREACLGLEVNLWDGDGSRALL